MKTQNRFFTLGAGALLAITLTAQTATADPRGHDRGGHSSEAAIKELHRNADELYFDFRREHGRHARGMEAAFLKALSELADDVHKVENILERDQSSRFVYSGVREIDQGLDQIEGMANRLRVDFNTRKNLESTRRSFNGFEHVWRASLDNRGGHDHGHDHDRGRGGHDGHDHDRGRDDHDRGRDDHDRGRDDHDRGRDDHDRGRDDHDRGRDGRDWDRTSNDRNDEVDARDVIRSIFGAIQENRRS